MSLSYSEATRCHYCLEVMSRAGGRTRDHIVPRALGGLNGMSGNVVYACPRCNVRKGHALFPEHCDVCIEAHRMWCEWVEYLASFDAKRAEELRTAYDLSLHIDLETIVGAPRYLLLTQSDREWLRETS